METSALARKLRVRPGNRLLLLAPPPGVDDLLTPVPDGVVATADSIDDGSQDVVVAFVPDRASVAGRFAAARAALRPGGVLWLAYPKQTSGVATDLSRDRGWEGVREAGWDPVAQVAVDAVWSALRFRPVEEIRRNGH